MEFFRRVMAGKASSMASVASCAVIWGMIGICTDRLAGAGMGSIQINAVRALVCLLAICAAATLFDRGAFRIDKRGLLLVVPAALTKVFMDVLYIQAQTMVGFSAAGVLLSTNCYFALAISYLFFRDRIPARRIAAAAIGSAGCALAVGIMTGVGEVSMIGITIGLGAGLGEAMHAATFKLVLDKGYSETTALIYVFLLSTAILIPFSDPVGTARLVFSDVSVLAASIAIGLVFTALPYYLYSRGLKGLDIGTVSVVMFLETATAATIGPVLFGETATAFSAIGVGLIFLSVVILNTGSGARKTDKRRMLRRSDVEDRRHTS
ncbi:MAG: DMT family transporter [Candidatus Methanomethylophilaceae archaeon]|nr:DMT family transporter [Candidatus Methanomethylophilaceae archaeon]